MFWRFGFHAVSAIDSLLDKEDVQLEAILDEDDLLQECKAQNTRLIDYFQRVDVLQRLFGYVTGQIESENKGRFKYPHVATEVLCSEIWSIVETCVAHQSQLLLPFWETVLDKPPDETKAQTAMLAYFAKINSVFMTKKPAEMFAFIRSITAALDRLLVHIEAPSIVDLLIRIVQLDEQPTGAGVLEWLTSENFIGKLLKLLSPEHSPDVHAVVADLIKSVISMATPSPVAVGLSDNIHTGAASNQFAREVSRKENIERLVSYIFIDFSPPPDDIEEEKDRSGESDREQEQSEEGAMEGRKPLPNFESQTSSVVQTISLIIELIRKNNSDYFEPYLFHTLRNRLIQVQQQQTQAAHGDVDDGEGADPDGREELEQAMREMSDRMGVVHLGPVLESLIPKLDMLQGYLLRPRSVNAPIKTTVGPLMPLSFERYRISELFAELLHCSNMALLNRLPAANELYDADGRLRGGLTALEELAQLIAQSSPREPETQDEDENEENTLGLERSGLPVHGQSKGHTRHGDSEGSLGMGTDSDEYMSDDEPGSSDDDAMEEIAMYDEPIGGPTLSEEQAKVDEALPLSVSGATSSPVPFSPMNSSDLSPSLSLHSHNSHRVLSRHNTVGTVTEETTRPVGERLKKRYIEIGILNTLLDLFFEFPWNNFLHSAVYDVLHQVLTGNVEGGANRELAVSLFRDARLMYRIVEGQKKSDAETSKPFGVRLGYMGHLTLISEDVITALERFPPELRLILIEYAPVPGWDEYVTGRYDETRKKDSKILGGGKPAVPSADGARGATHRWKIDEEDEGIGGIGGSGGGLRRDFNRTTDAHGGPVRNTADFGRAEVKVEEDEDEGLQPAPQFARYLAQELHSSSTANVGSSGSDDDDDDEDGGWLSQSTFSLGPPPLSARHRSMATERRPLSLDAHGFDDLFGSNTPGVNAGNPFNPDGNDAFGPFSDAAVSDADPFNFSSFPDDMVNSSFDSGFGDFGDFQSAGDGELTPTTGSWTFASGSNTDEAGSESGRSPELETVSIDLDSGPTQGRRGL